MLLKTQSLLFIFLLFVTTSLNAQNACEPIVNKNTVFEEKNGSVLVEAEHFYKQSKSEIRRWYITSEEQQVDVGRDDDPSHHETASNGMYIEILPDTRVTHDDELIGGENFSNTPGVMGILHYQVNISAPGCYYVWARAYSAGAEDNGLHVGMDGKWPESGQRLQWCEGKNGWRWESKQRTEAVHCGEPFLIYLDIKKAGVHDITFSMREDGFEFDAFMLTTQKSETFPL